MSLLAERRLSHQQATSAHGHSLAWGRPRLPGRCRRRLAARAELGEQHQGPFAPRGVADLAGLAGAGGSSAAQQQGAPIRPEAVKTRYIAETLLPTRHGTFRLRGYKHSLDGGVSFTEPTAIISGQVEGQSDVPLRVHDACFTSEVLGSLKCDCAEQLQLALDFIQQGGCGLVIYLQQEGRGIGLANKIAAYALQEQGLDTVDANRALGLPDDCREYTSVRNILRDLQVRSVRLMTNNPRKIDVLTQLGVTITGRIPCQVQAGQYNQGYLEAKRDRMDHFLDGSWCYWNHGGEPTQPTSTVLSEQSGQGGMGLPLGIEEAQGESMSPALAMHTVQMDEDEAEGSSPEQPARSSSTSISSDSSSSSSSRQPALRPRSNGSSVPAAATGSSGDSGTGSR